MSYIFIYSFTCMQTCMHSHTANEEYDKAQQAFTNARTVFKEVADFQGEILVCYEIAKLYIKCGEVTEAIKAVKSARIVCQGAGNRTEEVAALCRLSSIFIDKKQFIEGEQFLKAARLICQG